MEMGRYLVEAHLREGRSVADLAAAHGVHRSWIHKAGAERCSAGPAQWRGRRMRERRARGPLLGKDPQRAKHRLPESYCCPLATAPPPAILTGFLPRIRSTFVHWIVWCWQPLVRHPHSHPAPNAERVRHIRSGPESLSRRAAGGARVPDAVSILVSAG